MKCQIFVDILLLIGAVYLFSMCSENNKRTVYNDDNITHANYEINHYIDTINGHIILTTVVDNSHLDLSVSTLELNNN